jgi:hypothetical protein
MATDLFLAFKEKNRISDVYSIKSRTFCLFSLLCALFLHCLFCRFKHISGHIQAISQRNNNEFTISPKMTDCLSLDIEDEFHFILVCPCYNNIRKIYIKYIWCYTINVQIYSAIANLKQAFIDELSEIH